MAAPRDFFDAREKWGEIRELPSASGFDLDAAYALELEIVRLREAAGYPAVGRKVAFANQAMWRILDIQTVAWAHMFEDTVHFAREGVADVSVGRYRSPKIEPEIVMKLRDPFLHNGLASVEWIALGFEIVDSPYPTWEFQPADFVAAWGFHAGLVVGEPLPVTSASMDDIANQLADFRLSLLRNNEFVEAGEGRNCLRSPALCLAELAQAAAHRGDPLQPGEIISTGSLTSAQPITAGQEWRAELNGLPLKSLRVQFS
ncbi:MAG: fumarylacetoacetate hydrolase family protein [Acidobacteriota bacterium]